MNELKVAEKRGGTWEPHPENRRRQLELAHQGHVRRKLGHWLSLLKIGLFL